jgi:hypothetical protein
LTIRDAGNESARDRPFEAQEHGERPFEFAVEMGPRIRPPVLIADIETVPPLGPTPRRHQGEIL